MRRVTTAVAVLAVISLVPAPAVGAAPMVGTASAVGAARMVGAAPVVGTAPGAVPDVPPGVGGAPYPRSPDGAGVSGPSAGDPVSPGRAGLGLAQPGGTADADRPRGPDLRLILSSAGPGYVGGDGVRLTITVQNASPWPASSVAVGLDLPERLAEPTAVDHRCDARMRLCEIGDVGVGERAVLAVTVGTTAPFAGRVSGRLRATLGPDRAATRRDRVGLRILRPSITVTPPVGRPGFVPRVEGRRFPPGAVVRLIWSRGVTAEPERLRVGPDGAFHASRVIVRNDRTGPRRLRAEPVRGPDFAPVVSAEPFLVGAPAEPPFPLPGAVGEPYPGW